jgi:hypothetical protein
MDENQDEKTEEILFKPEGESPSSDKTVLNKTILIVIGVFVLTIAGAVFFYSFKKPKTAGQPTSPYTLTPSNATTAPGVPQNFTAVYPISGGWKNLSDASFYIAGGSHDQWVHYYPATKNFSLQGTAGRCTAGQATTLSTNFLILNCSASSVSGEGAKPTVTFSLTPKPSFSGVKYLLVVAAFDQAKASAGAVAGSWTVQ